jgi:DNA topoisomerase-1
MKLVIVESPNKIAAIKKYLGPDYDVAASVGHVRDLHPTDLSVDRETFEARYYPSEQGAQVLEKLRPKVRAASEVLLATDPDREGEAIAWHVAEELHLKDPKRITFTEITQAAVQKALLRPRKLDMNLVQAQECRRVIDRLVGWDVSPVLSRALEKQASAGRVQVPALRIVVEREEAIRAFKPVDYFKVTVTFSPGPSEWKAAWEPVDADGQADTSEIDGAEIEDAGAEVDESAAKRILVVDRAKAESAARATPHRVISVVEKRVDELPPAPFNTASLIQAASKRLGMKPKAVADASQALFAAGLITYHRTDSTNIAEDAFPAIVEALSERGVEPAAQRRTFKIAKGAQEGHEAIRPTNPSGKVSLDDRAHQGLYDLICERTLASQARACTAMRTTIRLEAKDGDVVHGYVTRGRRVEVMGWKALTMDDTTGVDTLSVRVSEGDVFSGVSEVSKASTTPPGRYTEASLTGELERRGIGRPATYASILQMIDDRGYWETVKKKLEPTEFGFAAIRAQRGMFSHADLDFTRGIEGLLDKVAAGAKSYLDVVKPYSGRLDQEIANFRKANPGRTCPKCGQGAFQRWRRKKDSEKSPDQFFWACSDREGCNFFADDVDGKPFKDPGPIPCPKCAKGQFRRLYSKERKGHFWGCSDRDGCNHMLPDDNGKPGKRREQKGAGAARAKGGSKVAQSGGRGR